ncbi:MAG: D-glycero-beta-D-manno-heptose-7-phosphate kinase, partial [Leptospira sp.]|nr:D-glycero-beta-D-manno-heptose-7-phosphate kinase [Leptospira sp.]
SIYIAKEKRHHHIPTVAKEVFDVTGAGDTVISVYTAFRVAGLTEIEAAIVSNSAAGVVVGKIGSATASADEISAALEQAKLFE